MTRRWNAVGVSVNQRSVRVERSFAIVAVLGAAQPHVGIFPVNGGRERHPCR